MKTKPHPGGAKFVLWLKKEKWTLLVLLLAAALLFGVRCYLRDEPEESGTLVPVTADFSAGAQVTSDMAVLTVHTDGELYAFSCGGRWLTCGDAEETLYFAKEREAGSEWDILELADGCCVLLNRAKYIESSSLAVCCIGGFTTYAYREGNAAFKMEFRSADASAQTPERLERLPENGENVLLCFPQKNAVLSASDEAETRAAAYEKGRVLAVTEDTAAPDEAADGAYRGRQLLTVEVLSGRYKGRTLTDVYHYVGPLNSVPVKEGDGVALIISTYEDGSVNASVYEYNRIPALAAVLAVFLLLVALVGGKTGIKSILGLAVTLFTLFFALIPLLLKGAPTLPAVFAAAAFIAAVTFAILGGVHRKTVCATLGAVAGTGIALAFALAAQTLARVDGLRISDVEPLLQLRQTGTPIGLTGLLAGGIVISALGAVMDVSMSISSALEEVHAADPGMGMRALFRSGMRIGRDMVGTMTNTLIMAFLGAGFTLIIYLYSLNLQFYQLLPSAYAAIELISGTAASAGMILSIPLTALISSVLLARNKAARAPQGKED